jgi:polyhydroxyalkanoate synthesis regulator phasin
MKFSQVNEVISNLNQKYVEKVPFEEKVKEINEVMKKNEQKMKEEFEKIDEKMKKELELKANKASVATALHRKSNRTEVAELDEQLKKLK